MSSLKDKMYSFEVTPPANMWEKINDSLDGHKSDNEISSKLYNLEAAPPSHVWEKINTVLNAELEVTAPAKRRSIPIFRYAAAAVVIIGLAIFGILKFSGRTTTEKEVAKENIVLPKDSTPLPKNEIPTPDVATTITDQQRDDAALEASKKTFAKLDMSEINKRKIKDAFMQAPIDLISSSSSSSTPQYIYREFCFPENSSATFSSDATTNIADRYILLMTPDGHFIRMSKKWADLLCCVSGEDEDEGCKDQLKKWRQKIAGSSLAPSPANFMDILSLIESLRDNNP